MSSALLFRKRLLPVPIFFHLLKPLSTGTTTASADLPPPAHLALLKSYNFSDSQISTLFSKRPSLLRSNPSLILAPKLDFLLSSTALPRSFLPDVLISNPTILTRSIDNHLKPTTDFLRCLFDSSDDLALFVRRNPSFLSCNFHGCVSPNIASLISIGVARERIVKLMTSHPRSFFRRPEFFWGNVEAVRKIGIRPANSMFIHALRALNGMRKSTWESRLRLFDEMGWSEELVYSAFLRAPLFVLVSEEKIKRSMKFFLEEVGLDLEELTMQPKLLMYSLEKRIIPRFRVFQVLEEKGFVGKGKSQKFVVSMFTRTDKEFLEKYVVKYSVEMPELMDIFISGKSSELRQ